MEESKAETSVKKGENPDETVAEMSLENEGEVVKASHESLVPDPKWVCKSPNAVITATSSGWGSFIDKKSSSSTYPLSAEEQATMAVLKLQHKALEACKKFLVRNSGSDSDEDDTDDEDELVENFDLKECEEYKFFEKVFAEDGVLRRYYENNRKKGDFYCLVCGGIGKKLWKRFKDCTTLIHHSTDILRTRRKRAHRAYAHVVSNVVGCDIDQLPAIAWKDLCSSYEGSRKVLGFEKEGGNLDEKISVEPSSENGGEIVKASDETLVTDVKWVCKSPNAGISATSSGWPAFDDVKSSSLSYSLSAEEQATVVVLQLQQKALQSCQKFLVGDTGSDSDEDGKDDISSDSEDEEKEDELVDNHDSKECKEYKFFEKVFAEDDDLRKYYENNHRNGDFYCLVCGGIRKKVWKRFKDGIALIQHSTSILRTKRRRAHRAYAQVICKVVGWDIDQLPAIVLKDLDSSLAGSKKLLVEPKQPAAGCIDDSNAEPDNSTDNRLDD